MKRLREMKRYVALRVLFENHTSFDQNYFDSYFIESCLVIKIAGTEKEILRFFEKKIQIQWVEPSRN